MKYGIPISMQMKERMNAALDLQSYITMRSVAPMFL